MFEWMELTAVSSWAGEPAGQGQHAQTMVVSKVPTQLSEHSDDCSLNLPSPDKLLCSQPECKPLPESNSGNLISSSARLTHGKPSQLYTQSHSALRIHCDASFTLVLSGLMPDTLARGWRKRRGRAKVRGGVKGLNFQETLERSWLENGQLFGDEGGNQYQVLILFK